MNSIREETVPCKVLVTFFLLFYFVLPIRSLGQTTIKEQMVLTPDSVRRSAFRSTTLSTAIANTPIHYVVQQNGPFNIVFENGRRISSPLAKNSSLTITVTDSTGRQKYQRKLFPGNYFSSPVQGTLTPDCPDPWYLYGKGPFKWYSGSSDSSVADAEVFSLDCSSRYAQATNLCQTSNFGNIPYLAAEAWTWYGTPVLFVVTCDLAASISLGRYVWIQPCCRYSIRDTPPN